MSKILILILLLGCAHQKSTKDKKYSRKDWSHWSDENRDCLNTRHEILKSRSHVEVTMNKEGCKVVTGMWDDYYYPEVHTAAKNVDIDHLIPLKHAHKHGAAKWTAKEKKDFANDPDNLVVTNKVYNRKKGAKGIDQWLPVHKEYACKFTKDWLKIKAKYKLAVSDKEKDTVHELSCPK